MEQCASSTPQPQRRAVEIADVLAALAVSLLFASLFLGWFRHEQASQLNGIGILFPSTNGNLIIVESGWRASADVGAAVIVMAGIAIGQVLIARFGFRGFGVAPGLGLAAGGALVAVLILHLIDAPPAVYTRLQPGLYVALALAIACIASGLASAAAHGARLSGFDLRRLDPGGLIAALGGALLLVTMSLGWYSGRKYFGGSMPGYTPPNSLSPWAADDWVAYPLAAVAVAAIVLWLARGFRLPRHPGLASIALASGACIAAILVLKRIDDPHSSTRNLYRFDQLTTGIYMSLAGCLAIVAGACWSALRMSRRDLAGEWRAARAALGFGASPPLEAEPEPGEPGLRRLPAPAVAGSLLALLIAALFVSWSPVASLIVFAGFAVGFALKRWWLLPIPLAIAILLSVGEAEPCSATATDCDTSVIGVFVVLTLGTVVCVTMAIGVIARRLSARAGLTSLRRRSS
jgi:hypothetical protein